MTSAPTFVWDISDLERELSDGYVYNVFFTVDAKDADYSASTYGHVNLNRPKDDFIPFPDLTKELVLNWVANALGSEKLDVIKDLLKAKLDEQRNPTSAKGCPWSN